MQLTFNPPTKSASPSEQTATKRRRSDRIHSPVPGKTLDKSSDKSGKQERAIA
jgi:hypothetical protein